MKTNFLIRILLLSITLCCGTTLAVSNSNVRNEVVKPEEPQLLEIQKREIQLQNKAQELQKQLTETKQQLIELQHDKSDIERSKQFGSMQSRKGRLQWVFAKDGAVPKNAVIATKDQKQLIHICRADYLDGLYPGELVNKGCLITFNGKALLQKKYQVLTGTQKTIWKAPNFLILSQELNNPYYLSDPTQTSSRDVMPAIFPIKGGFEPERVLFICRAMQGQDIHIGKVVNNNCTIVVNGVEISVPTFEVLFGYL